MATNTDIPQGYKATALGIIPQEWEAMRLSDVCTLINGRAYKQNELLSKGKYKILRVGNFFTNDSWYFSDMELDPNKYAYKGDLLYAWSASFGPRFWTGDKVIYHYHIWKICNLKGINQQYLYFFLDYDASLLQRDTQGGTMHHITKENMEKRFIPVPPLAEQRKIAEVLGVWDEAIEKQARLIEKLALRKRGLMQRLLSAKLRLPGFSDPWQKVKFCELFTKSIKTADPLTKYEVLSVTKEGIVAQKSYFNKDIASEDTSKYIVVERGDLAMSGLNFWMGSCHILTNFNEGIISPAYKVFKVTEHNNINFIRDFVRSSMFLQALQGCSVIGASIVRRNLDKEMLYEWTFKIPSLKEQTAIAKVLTAADREIELAKEKHERLRHQKRGLMQQLLTGKKRVKY
mgnify:CR=1 FL=1